MLKFEDLAKEINKAINAKDKDGILQPPSPEMEAYAKAVITITKATTTHIAGTVTGTTAAGSPLVAGKAQNGILTAFLPAPWLGELVKGFPTADPSQLAKDASASVGYITGAAKVNFKVGSITGTASSTPTNPGPLLLGAGQNGTIDELSGSDWSKLVLPPTGDPALASKIYTAISNYIKKNATVSYLPSSVVGVCPPVSGPLSAGAATGGKIV